VLLDLLLIPFLVAANAAFVAAEFGLVAVRRSRIEQLAARGSRRASSARRAIGQLNLMLSGCQLGITLASLGLGWVGEPALAHLFRGAFDGLPSPFDAIATHGTAGTVAFALITFLHVALGELVPKNVAIAMPEPTALWTATFIRAFVFVFRPVIWLFNETASLVVRALGIEPQPEHASVHDREEIAIIVNEARRRGVLGDVSGEVVQRSLRFADKRAADAMTPRADMVEVAPEHRLADVLDVVARHGFTRFPVRDEGEDDYLGVVYLEDLIRATKASNGRGVTVREVLRTPLLLAESTTLERVLERMRAATTHFALVIDEFGSTTGLITLEDVLEEVAGDVLEEHEEAAHRVLHTDDGVRVPGGLDADEFEQRTGLRLPEGPYRTVAGFVLHRLGRLPRPGDEVPLGDRWSLRVADVRRRRIVWVDVRERAPAATPARPRPRRAGSGPPS
jgi:magnesium and cobalt exporter, CNNM family